LVRLARSTARQRKRRDDREHHPADRRPVPPADLSALRDQRLGRDLADHRRAIYQAALPLLTGQRAELLDEPRLVLVGKRGTPMFSEHVPAPGAGGRPTWSAADIRRFAEEAGRQALDLWDPRWGAVPVIRNPKRIGVHGPFHPGRARQI
jgi:hypothetical protein